MIKTMMKILVTSVALLSVLSNLNMDKLCTVKYTTDQFKLLFSEKDEKEEIDRTYEKLIKNFSENVFQKHSSSYIYKQEHPYYLMKCVVPLEKNIVYVLEKFDITTYEKFCELIEGKKHFMFFDSLYDCDNNTSKYITENFDFGHTFYVMEGKPKIIIEALQQNNESDKSFRIERVKDKSFKNVYESLYFDYWVNVLLHDEMLDEDHRVQLTNKIKYFLLCKKLKLFVGINKVDDEKEYPLATHAIYQLDSSVLLLPGFHKIQIAQEKDQENNNEFIEKKTLFYKKAMILKALQGIQESTSKVIVSCPKEDESFYASLGMNRKRTLYQYRSKE